MHEHVPRVRFVDIRFAVDPVSVLVHRVADEVGDVRTDLKDIISLQGLAGEGEAEGAVAGGLEGGDGDGSAGAGEGDVVEREGRGGR